MTFIPAISAVIRDKWLSYWPFWSVWNITDSHPGQFGRDGRYEKSKILNSHKSWPVWEDHCSAVMKPFWNLLTAISQQAAYPLCITTVVPLIPASRYENQRFSCFFITAIVSGMRATHRSLIPAKLTAGMRGTTVYESEFLSAANGQRPSNYLSCCCCSSSCCLAIR